MRAISVVVLSCSLLLASPTFAQEEAEWSKRVFGFAGFGNEISFSNFFVVGGGFETISPMGLGFVIDVGYLQYDAAGNYYLSMSAAAVYEFPLESRVRPYARGGLGFIADLEDEGGHAVWNVGGGINYWFHERVGLKAEVGYSRGRSYYRNGLVEATFGVMYRF